MKKIFLTFSNKDSGQKQKLGWALEPSNLAQKWFGEMWSALAQDNSVREQKFFGWGNHRDDAIISELNHSIKLINNFFEGHYKIRESASSLISQQELNKLHHHFEVLMGQSWNRSEYLHGAPANIHMAVRQLNDLVHELEYSWGSKSSRLNGGFQLQLVPYKQQELDLDDFALFSFQNEPGNLVTSYCQLGKTWSDAYLDADQDISHANIAPLRYFSSSFIANFFRCSESDSISFTKKVRDFIRGYSEKSNIFIDPMDPRNALGYATYAKPIESSPLLYWNDDQMRDFFIHFNSVTQISLEDKARFIERTFSIENTFEGIEALQI